MKKKNITIEDLAILTQQEFNEMRDQFGIINKRFDGLEASNQIIIKKLESVVFRNEFEKLEFRVTELENLLAFNGKKH